MGQPLESRTHPLPRLGFLGTGWIGRHRLEAIAQSGLAEIAAIADSSPAMLEQAIASAPACLRARSLDELLEANLDGLVIATPSALHAEQSIRALERGLAVFCQKPLGRNADEVRRVVDAARRADRLLGVDLCYRHLRGVDRLRELVLSGELGEVFGIDLVFHNAYGPDKPWFYQRALSGGGCVMDLGIHLVDFASWVLGFPKVERVESRLYAKGRPLSPEALSTEVEDYALARLDFATGATAQLSCSWNLPAGCDCVIEASFYGTLGGAALKNVNGSFYDFTVVRHRRTSSEVLAEPPDAWGGRAAVAWARRVGSGARFDPDAERLVDVAEILDRIYAP